MSDISANLALPYLAPSQAQKHITHNEALQILDAVVQLSVVARDQSDPPVGAATGARYIVAPGATADWAGQAGRVALWSGSGWLFMPPQTGWRAWVEAEGIEVVWQGDLWQASSGLDNLARVGINTAADGTNRLAVSAPATLLNHEGGGHQLKVNKATAAETASLLFQSGFSGRAEMGLAGSDAWSIKVSSDGSGWTEALMLDPATGLASGAAVQASPQDAGAGRLMAVGAFGLGGDEITITPAELDTLDASGFYRLDGVIPARFDNGSRFIHSQHGPGAAMQLGFRHGSDVMQWRRKLGGVWQDWQEIFSQARILGTVSQSAGVPTGAIIEQGVNANGTYVRFADGTQICHQSHTHASVVFTASGGLRRSDNYHPTNWPVIFAAGATVDVSSDFRGLNTTSMWGSAAGTTTHSAPCDSYRFILGAGSGVPDCRASFTGIGRWY